MKDWVDKGLKVVGGLAQVITPLYFAWIFWKDEVLHTFIVLRDVTGDSLVHATMACATIGACLFILDRRFTDMHTSVYEWAARRTSGAWHRRLHTASYAFEGIGGPRLFLFQWGSSHWLGAKIEWWTERIFLLVFWPVAIVLLARLLYEGGRAPMWAGVFSLLILVALALLGMKLRNLAVTGLLLMWLAGVFYVQGAPATLVQAALVGLSLTLWGLWERWNAKIREEGAAAGKPEQQDPPSELT